LALGPTARELTDDEADIDGLSSSHVTGAMLPQREFFLPSA
jgi:hypothetical protein